MNKKSGITILLLLSIIINLCLFYLFRLEIVASLKSYKNNDFKKIDTRLFYYSFDNFEEISLKLNNNTCVELNDSLIVKPNNYKIGKSCVNLGKEGLYRILNSDGLIRHVIVFQSDLFQLLSSISWIVTHGNEHNKLDFNGKQAQATKGKLFLTCSRIVGFTSLILDRYKIKSRVIQTFGSEHLNGYDDEHVLLEVFDPKVQKWILIDLDNNVWFSLEKVKLSLVEYKSALDSSKNIKLEKLSNDASVDISNFSQNGKNFYGLISENVIGIENLSRFHKRVMEIVTIDKFFYNEQKIDFMAKKEPKYKFKNHNDFLKEFY